MTRKQGLKFLESAIAATLLPERTPFPLDELVTIAQLPWVKFQKQADGAVYIQASIISFEAR